MKYFNLIILTLLLATGLQAQTADEAIQYSNLEIGGTARTIGLAGAYGAVGADFGGLSTNPAGLGFYRRSELIFSPSLQVTKNEASYLNSLSNETGYGFAFSNIGWVSNLVKAKEGKNNGLVGASMALGINRLNSYFDQRYVEGTNDQAMDNFTDNYITSPLGNTTVLHQEISNVRGGSNEVVLGLGMNYSHKFYLGAQLGIPYLRYNSQINYVETDLNNEVIGFDKIDVREALNTSGVGINGKFGLIYRHSALWRAGLAIHTPSLMSLNDEYGERIDYTSDNESGQTTETSLDDFENNFTYLLKTPGKIVASGAFFPNNKGFISVDYELQNFSNARYDNASSDVNVNNQAFFSQVNQQISNDYGWGHKIKVGVEYAPDIFRFRAGYAFQSSPLKTSSLGAPNHILSAGIGVRTRYVMVDLGYATSANQYDYRLFTLGSAAEINKRQNQVVLSLGFHL